jgi:hypothetical protein
MDDKTSQFTDEDFLAIGRAVVEGATAHADGNLRRTLASGRPFDGPLDGGKFKVVFSLAANDHHALTALSEDERVALASHPEMWPPKCCICISTGYGWDICRGWCCPGV